MFIPLLCLHGSCWIVYYPSMSFMTTLWHLAERRNLNMHKVFWNVCSSYFLNVCTKMDVIYKLWSTVTWQETGQNPFLVTCAHSSFGVSRALFIHVCVQVDTHNCKNCQAVLFALYMFKDHLGFSLLSKLELIHMHFSLVCVEESRKFNYFFKRLFEQIHEMSSRYF